MAANDRTSLLARDARDSSYTGSFHERESQEISVDFLEQHIAGASGGSGSGSGSGNANINTNTNAKPDDDNYSHSTLNSQSSFRSIIAWTGRTWTLRRIALELSLTFNVLITIAKAVAFFQTKSLSVLAALLDSVLDVVSQIVLSYTDHHSSSLQKRSSAVYPAGAARLEPIGVLTCAALMGMASFEVVKESAETLIWRTDTLEHVTLEDEWLSLWSMSIIVVIKLFLLVLCQRAAHRRRKTTATSAYAHHAMSSAVQESYRLDTENLDDLDSQNSQEKPLPLQPDVEKNVTAGETETITANTSSLVEDPDTNTEQVLSDPTLEALAQDHWNDALSNTVAFIALLCALYSPSLWWVDPVGAISISLYIIYSWYDTGREQIEHLTGKSAPDDFIEELRELATHFDDRILVVDTVRAYHFGPKFLVELEVVLPHDTLLHTSHDLGMELQYEIEGREEVERCFVHIDYETRAYDEHVVSKVPSHVRHQLVQRRIVPPSTTS